MDGIRLQRLMEGALCIYQGFEQKVYQRCGCNIWKKIQEEKMKQYESISKAREMTLLEECGCWPRCKPWDEEVVVNGVLRKAQMPREKVFHKNCGCLVYKEQLKDKTCCHIFQGEPGEIINETMDVEKDNVAEGNFTDSIQKLGMDGLMRENTNINPQFKENHLA
jgi:hypothetical protein